jgi:hypothetical protein
MQHFTEAVMANSALNKLFTLKNLFWTAAVCLSLSCLVYYSYGAYYKWNIRPDIGTTSRLIPSSEIPFPTITCCQGFNPKGLQWSFHCEPSHHMIKILDGVKMSRLRQVHQNYAATLLHSV